MTRGVLIMCVILASALCLAASTAPSVSGVSVAEGEFVTGGADDCSGYMKVIVNCGSKMCGGVDTTCPSLSRLDGGGPIRAKNVKHRSNGYCVACGGKCATGLTIGGGNSCRKISSPSFAE